LEQKGVLMKEQTKFEHEKVNDFNKNAKNDTAQNEKTSDELNADLMEINQNGEKSVKTNCVSDTQIHDGDSGTKNSAVSTIAKIGVLTALSYILYMFVKFPLPFLFPSFLDIQISDLPALLGGFAMGPIPACAIIVIKCLLKMPFTTTACVGEIGDIIIGIAFVLPAALYYKKHKNKKGAFIGILIGAVSCAVSAVIVNRFILIPFYVTMMFGGNWDILLNMVKPLYPTVTVQNFYAYYLGFGIAPFNILRCVISGGLAFLIYKPLSKALHWEYVRKNKSE